MDQTPPTPDQADETARATAPVYPVQEPAVVGTPTEAGGRASWFRRHRRAVAICAIAAVGLALGGGGTAAVAALQQRATDARYAAPNEGFGYGGPGGAQSGWGGARAQGGTATRSTTSATAATAAQEKGVVTITTTVDYGEGEAAGTGMILTSSGQVLTNNHVVEGSTAITVTVESTGKSYTATVVGTDSTDDVALLQLKGASGLDTVAIDDDGTATGDSITDVGNAEGTGNLVAAAGAITATDQQIQVSDEETGATKTLDGLLELDADIVSGDSGGPVLDSEGEVVGMATAASSGSAQVTGYAIPIQTALAVVKQIRTGEETSTVTIGLPAFLGVQLATSSTGSGVSVGSGVGAGSTATSGVTISGTIDGAAAATAGLAAGDTITSVDGTAVTDSDALSSAIAQHQPGDRISLVYTDAQGASHTVTVTLGEGPAA